MEGENENSEILDGLKDGLTLSQVGESSEKDKPDGDKPDGDKPDGDKPDGDKPDGDKPDGDKPDGDKPDEATKKEAVTTLLSGMLEGKYKTLEELNEADIPGQLVELDKLRDANKTLQGQLDKPALGFANEGIGKFNQFVKDTGIDNYTLFNKLDKTDLENMDEMEMLVLQQTIDNPTFIGNENQVKRMLIKKYNIDPKAVEDEKITQDDLDLNKLNMNSDAAKAKTSLSELKGKIRMPEKPPDTSQQTNKLSDEELKESRTKWGTVIGSMLGAFKELSLNPDGTEEPLMNFDVTSESKQPLTEFAVNYCVRNQLEPKKENIAEITDIIVGKYLRNNFNSILKAYGAKIEGDVKKKLEEEYENPSVLEGERGQHKEDFDDDGVNAAFKSEMDG